MLYEHSNNKKAIDPNAAGAPHITFAQATTLTFQGNRQLKCHRCGLANYIIYTYPNCNNKNKFNNGKLQNHNVGKQVKSQKGILKNKRNGKELSQVSQGKRTKSPKKNKSNGLGFVQLVKIEKILVMMNQITILFRLQEWRIL